jgi:hypothetical protein
VPDHRATSGRARRWVRALLLALGLGLVAYFVWSTGPKNVAVALGEAGPWLPLLALFEVLLVFTDVFAIAALLGPAATHVPMRSWLRSSALSYTCLALMPAGRTASEAARAAVLSRYVGSPRAVTAGAQLQAAALVADAMISILCAAVLVPFAARARGLPIMLVGNAVVVGVGGFTLLVLAHNERVAAAVGRRFPRLVAGLATGEGRPHTWGASACLWSFAGRALQVLEFGVAVVAVGGVLSLPSAAAAFGVHAVSATVGVAVPNQLGIADGAYVLYADILGFGALPARALAAMLAVRVTQVALALLGMLVPMLLGTTPQAPDVPSESR